MSSSPLLTLPSLAGLLERSDIWRGNRLAGQGEVLASGFAELDAELPGGGWPRGALIDLMHARSGIGELSLLLPALSALTARDEWVLLLAPPWRPHAPAWAAAGVALSRLLVVAPPEQARRAGQKGSQQIGNGRDVGERVGNGNSLGNRPGNAKKKWAERAGKGQRSEVLWTAEQVLRAGSVGAVLMWLPAATDAAQLRRLQLAAEAGGSSGFFLQDESRLAQPSPAPLRLQLAAARMIPAPPTPRQGAVQSVAESVADGRRRADSRALAVRIVKRRGASLARTLFLDLSGARSATGGTAPTDHAHSAHPSQPSHLSSVSPLSQPLQPSQPLRPLPSLSPALLSLSEHALACPLFPAAAA